MKIKNEQQQHKSLTGGFPKQVKLLGVFDLITEVLLVSLYLILFFVCRQFRHLIKVMAIAGDILKDDEFFGDVVDTPK